MKRRIADPILMLITILVIIGFQVYWLKDNYDRERRTMQIKTGVAFQEVIQELQAKKLKLPDVFMRSISADTKERMLVDENVTDTKSDLPVKSRRGIIRMTNVLRKRLGDSVKVDTVLKPAFFISLRKDSNGTIRRTLPLKYKVNDSMLKGRQIFIEEEYGSKMDHTAKGGRVITIINSKNNKLNDSLRIDSLLNSSGRIIVNKNFPGVVENTTSLKRRKFTDSNNHLIRVSADTNDHAFRILYTVDSLQDSLQLPEITKAYSASLKKQNLDIPFAITRGSVKANEEDDLTDVTVGLARPVTYHLSLGNTTPYLFKKLSLPILFSLFLVGVTIFSFVLLYRNLLRQQRLAEIKNEFISNMTHELKTPIATVAVAIEALKSFNAMHDPQKTKEYLDISGQELQRLDLLVDKVLKLSMFEKKEVELNKEHFDVKELTQEVLDTMKLQFERNHAVVNFSSEGNNFIINADKLHITSVIYNLLDNALKYRNEDPVINVALSAKQDTIELSVSDNGIGIEHEYQSKIFDKFFRVPTGNKHVVKGYGLGLSYVSHIIAQHKGTIHVESVINKGSTFTIKIPVDG